MNVLRIIIIVSLGLGVITCNKKDAQKIITSTPTKSTEKKVLQDGDLIFQISKSNQSQAIQLATGSKYSHMGIIFELDSQLYVYEAVQPVKITSLSDWIKRGVNSHYVVKRIQNSQQYFTEEGIEKMKSLAERFKGKDYDIYFEWSDEKIYCSELVWKIYKETFGLEIGKLQKLKEFDLTSPIVKQKIRERFGDNIPMNESVISPKAIFESDKLFTVEEN